MTETILPAIDVVTAAPETRRRRHEDAWRTAGLIALITALHLIAFGILAILVAPHHFRVGTQVFGLGLGITAYTLGARHAFDADHIAAIDNTTRKFMAQGKRAVSVGFWFALGHSTIVILLAAGIASGIRFATTLTSGGSSARQRLEITSTLASGGFLYVIAAVNLVSLAGIWRVFRAMQAGHFDESELERHLDSRGFMNRILGRLTRSIRRPGQMYVVGFLFGVGFDTATEVTLMVMAGSGAAAGLPWYAIVCLPLLFASGMSLFDTLDGTFMNVAYRWAFSNPVRKVYYNFTITGLSIAVAFLIGSIELTGLIHHQWNLSDPVTTWISNISLDNMGFVIVGLFVLVWAIAITYWRMAGVGRTHPHPIQRAN
ncbi:HoxN/HupN/NixA family nickel/cobalt transporter [Nocardia miyunensis]|uniref:HoxN/HupN/NixA family nickel/cobalt transporter n=1 Tax=Nocardia miyunensis TaxID=282684 RepID=UPI00082DC4B6|nr:HoxN/HupN/NixA family nickel/cobalt transporter [Nocardia miyunensis]